VVSALFFFPRGGSAQVARAFARALPAVGWQTTLAAGSLGRQSEQTNAGSFFSGLEVHPVDYSPALELPDPLAALLPFQPSYEDRPGAPDRVFAIVDDAASLSHFGSSATSPSEVRCPATRHEGKSADLQAFPSPSSSRIRTSSSKVRTSTASTTTGRSTS